MQLSNYQMMKLFNYHIIILSYYRKSPDINTKIERLLEIVLLELG